MLFSSLYLVRRLFRCLQQKNERLWMDFDGITFGCSLTADKQFFRF